MARINSTRPRLSMAKRRKPPVGASPGTLIISADLPKPRIRVFVYDAASIEEFDGVNVERLPELLALGKNLWVDVQGLGDEKLLKRLGEIFHIHLLALEDIVNVPSRPKAEEHDQHVLIVTRMLKVRDTFEVDSEQVSIFIGRKYILTFQERPGDVFEPVRRRLRAGGATGQTRREQADYLGYALFDTIIDAYFPVLTAIGDHLEVFEDEILSNSGGNHTLNRLNHLRHMLATIRREVAPQRDTVNSLIRDDTPFFSHEVQIYLRDTYDHCVQLTEIVETYRELVNGLLNTYLTVISNRTNEVMKVLTIMASIFAPLTFLAGIYGMNFDYMPELSKRWAYPALLMVMGGIAGLMVFYFWWRGWLGDLRPKRRRRRPERSAY